jgi:hypothetical protein
MSDQPKGPEEPRKRRGRPPEPPHLRLLKGRSPGRDSGGRLVDPKPKPPARDEPEDELLYDDAYFTAETGWRLDRLHLLHPAWWPQGYTMPPGWKPQPGQSWPWPPEA